MVRGAEMKPILEQLPQPYNSETVDAFQTWLSRLFDWDPDGLYGPKSGASLISIPDFQPQAGNFSYSCRSPSVSPTKILQAQCQMLDGGYRYSAIDLNSIIIALNGKFEWLDGTAQYPGNGKHNANEWWLLSEQEVEANGPHPEEVRVPVIARCKDDEGKAQTCYLTLDERITNDNGLLKFITPLGPLTIPLFTNYKVSTIAIAMVMAVEYRVSGNQREAIESHTQRLLQTRCLTDSALQPLEERLHAKAATLISIMWIKFCRTYTVDDLINYSRICKAILERLRTKAPADHRLAVLLGHYQVIPSYLKRQLKSIIKYAENSWGTPFINEAIHILRMGQEMITGDDEWMPFLKANLGKMFSLRYALTPDLEDLQTACALSETFCATYTKKDKYKASALLAIATCKWEEDKLSGEHNNKETILSTLQQAEDLSFGLGKFIIRGNRATYLLSHVGSFDTSEAVDSSDLADGLKLLKDLPSDFVVEGEKMLLADRIAHWCNKSRLFCGIFQARPRDSSLIDEAITCAKIAVSECRAATSEQGLSLELFVTALATHAHVLAIRFKISESSDDLSRVIDIYKEALTLCEPLSRVRTDVLYALSRHQLLRYERMMALKKSENRQDLLDALENAKAAYQSPVSDIGQHGLYASVYTYVLVKSHGSSIDLAGLDEAIQIATNTLEAVPNGETTRILLEATKCELLLHRFLLQPAKASYHLAMDAARSYIQLDPLRTMDGPRQATRIMSSAFQVFKKKARALGEDLYEKDVSFVKEQCDQILNLDHAQARFRIEAGMTLGHLWCASKDWSPAKEAFEKTMRLLKRLVARSLSRADQEWLLRNFSKDLPPIAGLVALYAAQADKLSEEEAVLSSLQHLESGRGILANLVFRSRWTMEHLRPVDKGAAEEYSTLLDQLALLETVTRLHEDQTVSDRNDKREVDIIQRRAKISKRIYELEDFSISNAENISVDSLTSLVGTSALVYIVATSDTAVALLITSTGLREITLPELKPSAIIEALNRLYGPSRLSKAKPLQVKKANLTLSEMLKWLWDGAVKPILSELGYYPRRKGSYINRLPRLWWCASGTISRLPFHAAGEGPQSSENVYNYAVSSFTASLAALKMAQEGRKPSKKMISSDMLVVGMPTTPEPGWRPLSSEKELGSIKDATASVPTCLTNPRKQEVVEELSKHSIIHFICHGTSISNDPSSSALILGRRDAIAAERLTVKELSLINLENARIAYLSACSTAENSSQELSDESIHLASAFQLAGFPHVIAAFWEMKDAAGPVLAGLFYRHLKQAVADLDTFDSNSHDVVAYALHGALGEMRKGAKTKDPLFWAPVVHAGA